jgi:hypothetical protein
VTTVAAAPSARHVRRWLRRARLAHSDRTLGELLGDVYMVALLAALYGGSSVVSIRRHLAEPLGVPAGQEARAWLVLALLVTAVAVAWRALRTLGPLLTTPAAQSWCVATPVDRADWLGRPLRWLTLATALAGAGLAVLGAWAGISTGTAYGWAAVAGVGLGSAVGGLAVVAQARPEARPEARPDGARYRSLILVGCVVLVAAALVLGSRRPELAPPRVPVTIVAVVGLAVAGRALVRARRALSRVDRTTLAGGARIAGAAMSAAIMLDPTFISEIIAVRRWRAVGKVHSRHWRPGARRSVLLQADLRRQWRRRPDLLAWAALALAPYCVAAFAPGAVASARIVAAYIAVDRLAGGLRAVARSPALRRSLGGSDRALRRIHLVVPAVGLAVWWTGTLPAGATHAPIVDAVLTAGILAAVYRTATRKPIQYDGGLAHTPVGPIPVTLLRQVLRGPDLVAIVVLVGLFLPVTA